MNDDDTLARRFEENRPRLRAVAYRMLGSSSEADDAVQEAWIRLSRADSGSVENLGGWLTTVVARVSLDMLRSRRSRREDPLDTDLSGSVQDLTDDRADPEREALLADAVGPALLVILDTLTPAERLAFVLHDMFAVPFDEIAPIVGRSTEAARQLASRARRSVRGAGAPGSDSTRQRDARQREIVAAFLAASRDGQFEALLALLDPDVVLRADPTVVAASEARRAQGAPRLAPEIRGATTVASAFSGSARAARPALVDGTPGAAFAPGGRPRAVFRFTFDQEKIVGIEIIGDPARIGTLDVSLLDG